MNTFWRPKTYSKITHDEGLELLKIIKQHATEGVQKVWTDQFHTIIYLNNLYSLSIIHYNIIWHINKSYYVIQGPSFSIYYHHKDGQKETIYDTSFETSPLSSK